MIDRAIGIAGIALALVVAALQFYIAKAPAWMLPVGLAAGALLMGVSIGLISAGGLGRRHSRAKTARLRLHVFGDHRTPEQLESDNIFRWYYLQHLLVVPDTEGAERVRTVDTLFVSFGDDVPVTSCRVRSPDARLPLSEVKEFNPRFAIIAFAGAVPSGTLEILVSP